MKKVTVLMLALMVATVTFGGIGVSWSNRGFLSFNDDGSNLFANQDEATSRIVWDLIYTSTGSVADLKLVDGAGINDANPIDYGSDLVLSRREWLGDSDTHVKDNPQEIEGLDTATPSSSELTWNARAGVSGYTTYKNFDFTYTSGGLYAAVFQIMNDGTVHYATSAVVKELDWARTAQTLNPPENVNFNVAREYTLIGNTFDGKLAVPEPATMSLLGLGALAMVIRRKLRK